MGKLPPFENFTKNTDDLLKNGYVYGSLATVAYTRKAKGHIFSVTGTQTPNQETPWLSNIGLGAEVNVKEKAQKEKTEVDGKKKKVKVSGPTNVKIKLCEDQKTKISVSAKPLRFPKGVHPEVNVTLDHDTYGIDNALKFHYKRKGFQGFAEWGILKKYFNVSGVFGTKSMGFGFLTGLDIQKKSLTQYDFGFFKSFKKAGSQLALKHESVKDKAGPGDLVVSYFQKHKKLTVGGLIRTSIADKTNKMEFGIERKQKKGNLKCKFDSEGVLGLSMMSKAAKHLKLTSAIELPTSKMSSRSISEYRIGFRFDLK